MKEYMLNNTISIAEAFLSFTREKALNMGTRTIDHYNEANIHFCKAVDCSKNICDLTIEDMVQFVTELRNSGLSRASQSSYSKEINTFLNFCVRRKWLAENPFNRDIVPKTPDKEIIVFTDSQIDRIFEAAKPNKSLWVALNLLGLTGFRVSAMISLKMTDIDFEKNVIKLYNSKTKSYNEFPLYNQLKNFIKKNVPAMVMKDTYFPIVIAVEYIKCFTH